jgi:integrase
LNFYNRNNILYVRLNNKRISTKLEDTPKNRKLVESYYKNDEFFNKFNLTFSSAPNILFLCEEVLKEKSIYLKNTSFNMYNSIYKTHIIPYFNKKIDEIRSIDIHDWYKTFSNKSAIVTAEAILKPAFEKAILSGFISTSPFVISKPKIKSTYNPAPFTLSKIDILLSKTSGWFKNFIGLSLYSGLRTGEALALKWCDIDFTSYTIDVNKTQSSGFTQSPKTKSSIRIIDMLPQSELFLKQQFDLTNHQDYVFLSNTKKINSSSCLSPKWNQLLLVCSLKHRGIYQTRHSFASNMLSNGEDLNWVSQTLGHLNPSITQQKYFKYIPILRNGRKRTFLDIDTKSAH